MQEKNEQGRLANLLTRQNIGVVVVTFKFQPPSRGQKIDAWLEIERGNGTYLLCPFPCAC